jgi:hypothetical protein
MDSTVYFHLCEKVAAFFARNRHLLVGIRSQLLTFAPFVYFGTAPFQYSTSFDCASAAARILNLIENEGHVLFKELKLMVCIIEKCGEYWQHKGDKRK